jgi:hypothetical protein
LRFTQARPQAVTPSAQAAWHAPLTHTWLAPQAVPQAPQWLAFDVRSVHTPSQLAAEGQVLVQAPFEQAWPPVQKVSRAPQLLESEASAEQDVTGPSLP